MARVKGTTTKARHKKMLKAAKGYRHGRKNLYRQAKQAVVKAATFAYRDSRVKKRKARQLWIVRINAALKPHNIRYSEFICKLNKSDVGLDRKVLADMAVNHPEKFDEVVKKITAWARRRRTK